MIENNPTNVIAAFELLTEELEAEVEFTNRVGSKAFEARDYDRAREALERAGQLTAFRDKVVTLHREWDIIAAAQDGDEDENVRAERRNLGRLRRGMRTREEAYYGPILKTLAEMGGSARMSDVLDRVGALMKNQLRAVDFEPLASDPDMHRWRNSAQWARYSMVKEGMLKAESPRGFWEITDKGRRALQDAGGR